jgi:hypothetical protein
LSGNTAANGGGIYNDGSLTAANTIISLNTGGDLAGFGSVDLSDHNFVGGDPLLGPPPTTAATP